MLGLGGALAGGVRFANNLIRARNIGVNARNELMRYMRNRRFRQAGEVKTELDRPSRTEGVGHVVLGKNVQYTGSRRNVNLGSYGRPNNDSIKSITWRWQSVKPYSPLYVADMTQPNNRSLDLSIIRTEDLQTAATGMFMPVYAFDLGTQPGQGIYGTSKTGHNLQSIPMYRLRKNFTVGTALSSSVDNYVWTPVLGLNNYSHNASTAYSPYWCQEIKDTDPQAYQQVKRCWNDIELLFQCNRTMECKIHVAVVKFDRFTGPRRNYSQGDTSVTVANAQQALPTLYTYDETVVGNDRSGVDVFWESFFDKRYAHPLSQYNQANKTRRIKFISHEVIDCHPDPNIYNSGTTTADEYTVGPPPALSHTITGGTTNITGSGVTYTHKKKLFVRGGKWINCASNVPADGQFARGTYMYGQQPPVVCTGGGPSDNGFDKSYGFNVIDRTVQAVHLIDDYSRKHEDGNPWLLVWMEQPIPVTYHVGGYVDGTYKWAPDDTFNTTYNPGCCSFDVKVRSKMLYTQPEQQINLSTGAVTALGNVA